MKIAKWTGAALAVCLLSAGFAGQANAQTKVTFGLPSKGFLHMAVYVANGMKYFQAEGLEPEFIYLKGGSAAVSALISEGVEVSVVDPTSAMHAHEKGADVVAFGAEMKQYGSNLVVQGDIAQKANLNAEMDPHERLKVLKGLRIGITGVGGTPDLLVRYLSRQVGYDPDRDVTLVPLGDASAILAAFKQKRIDGFALSSPTSDVAVSQLGGFMLLNLASGEYEPLAGFPAETLLAKSSWLEENPDTAVRVVKAFTSALRLMAEDPEKAKAALRADFKDTDQAIFDAAYENSRSAYPKSMELTEETVKKMLAFFETTSGHPFKGDPKKFFVNDFVEKAGQ